MGASPMSNKLYSQLLVTATIAFALCAVSKPMVLWGEETSTFVETKARGLVSTTSFSLPEKGLTEDEVKKLNVVAKIIDQISTQTSTERILGETKDAPHLLWFDRASAETRFTEISLAMRQFIVDPSQFELEVALICDCGALRIQFWSKLARTPEEVLSSNPSDPIFIVGQIAVLTFESREVFFVDFNYATGKMRRLTYGEVKDPVEAYVQQLSPLPLPIDLFPDESIAWIKNYLSLKLLYKTRHISEWNEEGELVSEIFPEEPIEVEDVRREWNAFLKRVEEIKKRRKSEEEERKPTE